MKLVKILKVMSVDHRIIQQLVDLEARQESKTPEAGQDSDNHVHELFG